MFVDAHAHLTFDENEDVTALLERAKLAGIKAIINVCTDLGDLQRGLDLAASSEVPKIYTVAALTPHDAAKDDEGFFKEIERRAWAKELVAIGETGLDYYYQHASREAQQMSLCRYLGLAKEAKLPVVIHCRDAFDDLCKILDKYAPLEVMLHCFTGTQDEAKQALERGWYISLSGIVTFPKSKELQQVAKIVPEDRLLLETDSPYLAPNGFRGKKNEPAYLVETAKFVAALREVSLERLAESTTNNIQRLFHVVS